MSESAEKPKKRYLSAIKWAVRLLVIALVAWGMSRGITNAQAEFEANEFSISSVDWRWLVLGGAFYILGMAPSWLFWHKTLQAMGQRPRYLETLKAFYIGHLGKYVPGKALVVVLRTSLVRSSRVDTTVAATSVFVETLTMMAVGAFTASALLAALYHEHWKMLLLAAGLMVGAGLPTLPPIFRRIVRLLQVHRANPRIDAALEGLNWRLMFSGWITIGLGWGLLGLSLWAMLKAMPGEALAGRSLLEAYPMITACVSLAMVAGFVSLLPGGIGVRETVVMTLLEPEFGAVAAIVSAILLRLVWLLSEALVSGILFLAIRSPKDLPEEAFVDKNA